MKIRKIAMVLLVALSLAACENQQVVDEIGDIKPNYEGAYTAPTINNFAGIVNGGTARYATGNVFTRHSLQGRMNRAIEVYPGSTYVPDLPKLQKGYYAEILFEEVNKHGEKPKELYAITTRDPEEAKVDIPDKPGKLFRYTLTIRDENDEFKDRRYDPLFTTFEDYNFVMNVRKPVYNQYEKITLNIENWGPNYLSISKDWKLFKLESDEWMEVEFLIKNNTVGEPAIEPSAWNMDYLAIGPDAELLVADTDKTFVFNHVHLQKGQYKIQGKMGSAEHVFYLEDSFEVR
ncbi:hypothetical protein QT711_14545 [Sporosarcina saromensis]|uniref:Bacterial Ig-like domain-containing protein n=1 Tax=Sporosarcina saromensis TaxID=359365 RepID=A0ABU4GBR7_9BACL|nr:immunoglobulin-like domain-containing protein [Sporosarcina saromensis]MDW0114414.1 hypothetical protein [Sporosarcina saromensis]